MASRDISKPVDINNSSVTRRSSDLLPGYLRTDKNTKFLASTLDQFIQQPELERVNGFVGSKESVNYNASTDNYIDGGTPLRNAYQLEPSLVIKDVQGAINIALGYDDLINELGFSGADTSNLDRMFRPRSHSYDPRIDWDKFVNYNQYYWMPLGPDVIEITGLQKHTVSTYSVTDSADGNSLIFMPDGLTPTPLLTLYRGMTYIFNVTSKYSFYIKTSYVIGASNLYEGASGNGSKNGQVVLTVDDFTPNTLFYFAEGNPNAIGQISIKTLSEDTVIDVDASIVGKETFTANNGITLSNGMKIKFAGSVTPAYYENKEFFVEGVGSAIVLVDFASLTNVGTGTTNIDPNFDATPFDQYPFDDFQFLPLTPEYITSNRASPDANPWARYNRWVHKDVIAVTATANNVPLVYPNEMRAHRPIVEFVAGLQLYNSGAIAKQYVDLIDTSTANAFSTVEGTPGFYIDGVLVEQGHRVIFNADTDSLVRGKIYEVKFVIINNQQIINLEETLDSTPFINNAVLAIRGTQYAGSNWWFNGDKWVFGQQKTLTNQLPLFELYDNQGNRFSDQSIYQSSFLGTRVFNYAVGTGSNDPVLGFPFTYRNISSVGEYLFNNYYMTDKFNNFKNGAVEVINVSTGFLKLNDATGNSTFITVWSPAATRAVSVNSSRFYEPPTNLTNNPLNGSITDFSFSELSDHAKTIADNNSKFIGVFPGTNNLRDLKNISTFGTRLVSHDNPMSFAHYFLGTKENNIIDAIRKVSNDYNQFKSVLLRNIPKFKGTYTAAETLDNILVSLNSTKDTTASYNYSDMLAHGSSNVSRKFTVTDSRNVRYSLASLFDDSILSERAVLVYVNDSILVNKHDYLIEQYTPTITISKPLVKGDIITILDYSSTVGSFVPSTPTKLGLYPKFAPKIYVDDTYITPQCVIQGHDGNIMIAFTSVDAFKNNNIDDRDLVIMEYESRIFNNLKIQYNPELLDINSIIPGAFRKTDFLPNEITKFITPDFLRWASYFGVDYQTKVSDGHPFTYNYSGSFDSISNAPVSGYWRNIYKHFFDTDRPHTHPWEMLGFTEQPIWWESVYGPAPYTSGNGVMWKDLEDGRIASGTRAGIDSMYARPGLHKIIPVDASGVLLDPIDAGITDTTNISLEVSLWQAGDCAPAETTWRRSSYWPFVCQVVLALANPASYAALCFDPSRMHKNIAGQYKYGTSGIFLNPTNVLLFRDTVNNTRVLSSGYSVFVIEAGIARNINYLNVLNSDFANLDYNLMVKLGGFASKEKLQVGIDSVDPTSTYAGSLVPSEDYTIFYNQSSPIDSINISGLVIQKTERGWMVKGYDKYRPYFTIFTPFTSAFDQAEQVGGVSAPYVNWAPNTTYNIGDIVFNSDRYYRVLARHNSDTTFNKVYYQSLPYLPIVGGASVLRRTVFDTSETIINYGSEYYSVQDVDDLIMGYGKWLESKGFVFNEYNGDLDHVLDWSFSAREFLYWTTQNWAPNSIITLSPFANKLVFQSDVGVVNSITDSFYEYSLLKADGGAFPEHNFSIVRLDGVFSLSTVNTTDGIYFARLNLVQKEHALVLNNFTMFNDVVYDVESGYRQRRVKLKGFRTANWNGDFFSPGFIFDQAIINDWQKFTDYGVGEVVRFSGKYYSAPKTTPGTSAFNINQWIPLGDKPTPRLLPNFDYKINQFEDFYSLDIDNFDVGQQAMAQHLTGYTPRPYLNYIIGDPIAQYKFYQGFIRDKGSRASLNNLSKVSLNNFQTSVDFNEEWAFRIGHYGGFNTYQELEISLESNKFLENPQIIEFVPTKPIGTSNIVYYKDASDVVVKPDNFDITCVFVTTSTSNIIKLPIAGYVRFDDVSATVYNRSNILNITNNSTLLEGDTFWMGFRPDGEWDVLRLSKQPSAISDLAVYIPASSMIFSTYSSHNLAVGDLISVTKIDPAVNACYEVIEILSTTEFIVASSLTSLPSIATPINGALFVFSSSRVTTFDDIASIPYLERWKVGEKIWADPIDENDTWKVYEKNDNYQPVGNNFTDGTNQPGQNFGSAIAGSSDHKFIISSAPNYISLTSSGTVFVSYRDVLKTAPEIFSSYTLNDGLGGGYYTGNTPTLFGATLIFNQTARMVIAGAPLTSQVRSVYPGTAIVNVNGATNTGTVNQGVVKLSLLKDANSNFAEWADSTATVTVISESPATYFGASLAYSATNGRLIVGAPGSNSIYGYTVSVSTSSVSVVKSGSIVGYAGGLKFGTSLTGNLDLSMFAVTDPLHVSTLGSSGTIHVYYNNWPISSISSQSITGDDLPIPMQAGDTFASSIKMTQDGKMLIAGSPYAYDPVFGTKTGVVDIFIYNGIKFVHSQRIHASTVSLDTKFGYQVDVNDNVNSLVIAAHSQFASASATFDKYVYNDPLLSLKPVSTTFDSNSTVFYSSENNTGDSNIVHNYVKSPTGSKWVYAQDLTVPGTTATDSFGSAIFLNDNSIYVGAPGFSSVGVASNGQISIFDKTDINANSWNIFRQQEPLVDLEPIKRSITIENISEQVKDYLEIIDSVKGKILGTAAAELKYISSYDPALYNIGVDGVTVNSDANWLDEHVGELWWDTSSVKYIWYEQGDLEYRKNNWNNIFPGSTIDVYEWVRSSYLPSEWSAAENTNAGAAAGISGQPKFTNDSVVSVKQFYNSNSNSFSNVYYYWVKNKTTVPSNIPNRKIAASQISQNIANPVGSGVEFLAFISPTAVILANYKSSVITDTVNLNIGFDVINNSANRHTEWALMQENDPNSKPNWLLEKKLIDSLLGHDSINNPVPDPALPSKLKYGIGIRPRQSLFVNRREALRNIIEYSNGILLNNLITGKANFSNLLAADQLPAASTYDSIVEDIYILDLIPTKTLKTAKVSAVVDSVGKITNIIVDPLAAGAGYLTPPTITISDVGTGAEFNVNIDVQGKITSVDVIKGGTGYSTSIALTVRPYTAIVRTDSTSGGKWAKYEWDDVASTWTKTRTQNFDTSIYWKYIDWASADYSNFTIIEATVPSPYDLSELFYLSTGAYVKVQNGGDGRYLILSKTSGTGGTFDSDWNIVYSENGTIQFLDSIWNSTNTVFSWDQIVGFDVTSYDQTPDAEIKYILDALKDDIFVNEFKGYWNKLFLKAVRYALSEQKSLDWAFKTTFISVVNSAGSLDQRHTYKLQNASYYEDFLNEIKPYHTKIRKFTEVYTATDLSHSFNTDFDLPSFYDKRTLSFNTPSAYELTQYPWKAWNDNHGYGVSVINISNNGGGYTSTPIVTIIPAVGDTGAGAEAIAFISLGTVNRIIVTNPGRGYTITPTIKISGGGSTTLNSAQAYAQLGGSPVRANKVRMKFDRVSTTREIGNQYFSQVFVGNGIDSNFNLKWLPLNDKTTISLTKNGILQLSTDYSLLFYSTAYKTQYGRANNSYLKKYASLQMSYIPEIGDVIEITYPKSLELYTAVDRVEDYYAPNAGMPGKEIAQVMKGAEYPGVSVDTLPLNFAQGWSGTESGWDSAAWDNAGLVEGYLSFATTASSLAPLTIPFVINSGTQLNVYIQDISTNTSVARRIDGSSTSSLVQTIFGIGSGAIDRIEVPVPGAGYDAAFLDVFVAPPTSPTGRIAKITPNVSTGSIVSFTITDQGSGYLVAPVITIIEKLTTGHSTSTVTIPAFANAIIKSEFTATNTTGTISSIQIPSSVLTASTSLIVFRESTSDGTTTPTDADSLDALVSGGTWDKLTGKLSGALGVTPGDIIVDGDSFLSAVSSYAPEEFVPGQIQEAFGISVYTKPPVAAPLIVNKKYWVDGTMLTYKLGTTPSNRDSVIATFNGQKLVSSRYTIDFDANTFTFTNINPGTGWLSLTSMGAGTDSLLNYTTAVNATSSTIITTPVAYSDVKSSYVTVNGVSILENVDYTLTSDKSRAKFTITAPGVIQTYLFSKPFKSFSEVTEQIIISTGTSTTYVLTQPPGTVGPFHNQVIITKNGLRMLPPVTTYYEVTNGQRSFDISSTIVFDSGKVDLRHLEVYVNGKRSNTFDFWNFNQSANKVVFKNAALVDGDVIAIVVKRDNEYLIENNQLELISPSAPNDEYHITAFTNHDPDFIRTERYTGRASNQYVMQRKIVDVSYVWVSYNGTPLTASLDYSIDATNNAVRIREGIFTSPDDIVIITSFADYIPLDVTGYKIFRDMLGRTHYKRLSAPDTTELLLPLSMDDATITVKDSSVLTPGQPARNIPGVVMIDKERIEFFTISGNVLGQLRRSTLGTAPKPVYDIGTLVMDHGTTQNVPVNEVVQKFVVTATTTASVVAGYVLDGITFAANTPYTDQVEVRYAGRMLMKPFIDPTNITVTYNNIAYDSDPALDILVNPGFAINAGGVLTISTNSNFILTEGARLEVTKRMSNIWYDSPASTLTLAKNTTAQAKFLAEKPAALPAAIISSAPINVTATSAVLYTETGSILTDENGNPLEGGI